MALPVEVAGLASFCWPRPRHRTSDPSSFFLCCRKGQARNGSRLLREGKLGVPLFNRTRWFAPYLSALQECLVDVARCPREWIPGVGAPRPV